MNILITGGSGFVGGCLIKKLLKRNDIETITSIDNYFTGTCENEVNNDKVTYIKESTQNINSIDFLKNKKFDILYHFGEYSRISTSFEEPNTVFSSNLTGTYKVLEFCRINKCKLIYSGSTSIFGNDMNDQHSSPYSWSKAKNIELIHNYNKWFNLDFTIVYFSNVYGAGQISNGKYATVIGIFERQFNNREQLTVVKPGTQKRDFTHIDDTINGIILASFKGEGDGYVIRTGKQYSILEIAQLFTNNIKYIDEQRGNREESSGNYDKMLELGWKPKMHILNYIKTIKN